VVTVRVHRSTDAELDALASASARAEPTFSPGADYRRDVGSRRLRPGVGWAETREAIRGWRAHAGAGVRVRPGDPPTEGQTVALAIGLGPVFVLAPCRVISTVDTGDAYGFTYATLPGHPEEGEESFVVRPDGDRVVFDVTALSRPADWLVRLGGPLPRLIQHRTMAHYLDLGGLG
jgi:uncharacterized protein (UPF0548 family)